MIKSFLSLFLISVLIPSPILLDPIDQTITWSPTTSLNLSDSGSDFTAPTTDGDGTISTAVTDSGTTNCTVSGNTLTFTNTGTCTVRATASATVNYNQATKDIVFTISQGTFSISTPSSNPTANQTSFVDVCTSTCDLTGFANSDTVRVTITTTEGVIKLTDTSNLSTITGYSSANWTSGSATEIGFAASQSNVNNALETLQYKGSSSSAGTVVISANLDGAAYSPDTGHFYEVVDNGSAISWELARCKALYGSSATYGGTTESSGVASTSTQSNDRCTNNSTRRTFNGLRGYLVNITSLAEHQFLISKVTGVGWIGGADTDTEGTWIWMDGPEAGQVFWNGSQTRRTTNTINSISQFNYWSDGEPNDSNNEDFAEFGFGGNGVGSSWNDCRNGCGSRTKYIIEYGDTGDSALKQATSTIIITNTLANQSSLVLSISTDSKDYPFSKSLTLSTTGGSGTGTVTYSVVDGTASNCTLSSSSSPSTITADTLGTCTVYASKAADSDYNETTSAGVTFTFNAVVPSAPTDLTATAGEESVSLSWTAAASNGSTLTSHTIEYSTDNSNWNSDSGSGSITSYRVSSLSANTLYYFRIKSSNSVGDSQYTSAVTSTPIAAEQTTTESFNADGTNQTNLVFDYSYDDDRNICWNRLDSYSGAYGTTGQSLNYNTCNYQDAVLRMTFPDDNITFARFNIGAVDHAWYVTWNYSDGTSSSKNFWNATGASYATPMHTAPTGKYIESVDVEVDDYVLVDDISWTYDSTSSATTTTTTTSTTTTTIPKISVIIGGVEYLYTQQEIDDGTVDRDIERAENLIEFNCYMTDLQIDRGDCPTATTTTTSTTTTTTSTTTTTTSTTTTTTTTTLPPTTTSTTLSPTTTIPSITSTTTLPSNSNSEEVAPFNSDIFNNQTDDQYLFIEGQAADNSEINKISKSKLSIKDGETNLSLNFSCNIACNRDKFNNFEVELQGTIDVETTGFLSNSIVSVWLFSEPVLIGSATTDESGNLKTTFNTPEINVGKHTLQVIGTTNDGKNITANIPVEVVEVEVFQFVESLGPIGNVEINNELITSIPVFNEIDFTNPEENKAATQLSIYVIILFYIILMMQEWFNRIISEYKISIFNTERTYKESSTIKRRLKILFALITTAFLIGYVEEGANVSLSIENIAIFIAAFFGLLIATLSFEGLEGLIESKFYNQKVFFTWAPQAIIFVILSTLSFIYFKLPIGFLFGFFTSSNIEKDREQSKISPKFFALTSLLVFAVLTFYLTSLKLVLSSTLLTAVFGITYLMCLEGVIFKSIPGGGNELLEAIRDSKNYSKILPIGIFALGVWAFMRIIILPTGGEFQNMQADILGSGQALGFFIKFLLTYIVILFASGMSIKYFKREKIN